MTPSRILVIRSEPGASETAERLKARGYQPVVEPLFAVEPIAAALPWFDALAFTSANGVRAFAKLNGRRGAPVFCVGARTAETAREAGFDDVTSADGDVAALTGLIRGRLPPKSVLLHTGNEESRGDLAGQLKAAGGQAVFVPTYRAAPVSQPGPALTAHLGGLPAFEVVLVHSPRGAAILGGFAGSAPGHVRLDVAAISPAAAAPLKSFARRIEIAASPGEAALLDALARFSDLS